MEKLEKIGEGGETIRKEFRDWAEKEIKEADPAVVAQLRIMLDHEKDIPDEDLRLFEMYKSKDQDLEWENYEPVEGKILSELQEKNNNARRVFFNFFSKKVRPRAIGEELNEDMKKE